MDRAIHEGDDPVIILCKSFLFTHTPALVIFCAFIAVLYSSFLRVSFFYLTKEMIVDLVVLVIIWHVK
jgi:hypothetical protein